MILRLLDGLHASSSYATMPCRALAIMATQCMHANHLGCVHVALAPFRELSVLLGSPLQLAIKHEIALPCVGLSINCVKHVYIELYTWTSIRQSFFANNPGNAVSPNIFTAKVSYYTVYVAMSMV